MDGVIRAWGRILAGYRPNLSIEITRECPLHCPGCYAYGDDHLGGTTTLRELSDFRGDELVDRFFDTIRIHKPLHVSIVGGEPLVRYRELNQILPRLAEMGIYTQLVTSAVRPIPSEWAGLRRLQIVVSIDGLQPEHDARRQPATYDRILKHVNGHQITVHCTVTKQQTRRAGYVEEFIRFWSDQPSARTIWISLYTRRLASCRTNGSRPPTARGSSPNCAISACAIRSCRCRSVSSTRSKGPRRRRPTASSRARRPASRPTSAPTSPRVSSAAARLRQLRLHRICGTQGRRAPSARRPYSRRRDLRAFCSNRRPRASGSRA